jgi:hypothetical protein
MDQVVYELADLATAKDGTPLMYPKWFIRQLVKRKILSMLGLLDARIISAYEAWMAGGPAEEEAASIPYNSELDRVIEENELGAVVEAVLAAVTTNDPTAFE